jgi:hypothetical protein
VTGDPYNVREGETAEQFGDRIKALHTAPTWAEMRARADHADDAYRFLSSAPFNGDAEMARVMVDAATVHATLALHDKVEELTQTIKRGVEQMIETNADHECKHGNLQTDKVRRCLCFEPKALGGEGR